MLQIPRNVYFRYGLISVGVTGLLGSAFYFLRSYIPKRLGGTKEQSPNPTDNNTD